jgi:hypothetical protein
MKTPLKKSGSHRAHRAHGENMFCDKSNEPFGFKKIGYGVLRTFIGHLMEGMGFEKRLPSSVPL